MRIEQFAAKLQSWFLLHRRPLPWRATRSPYVVWVSEIMLQQTRVDVVIPHFQRWMKLFPTIQDLAKAPAEKVIKAWEGLGYYSRARYLHQGAQHLLKEHGGELPADYDALNRIKGLGAYTIGAILAFAFNQRIPAVDGNVLRVIARYHLIKEYIDNSATYKKIEKLTSALLPKKEAWVVMEALIELGALVCTKRAQCPLCPIKEGCRAYRESQVNLLPNKRQREKLLHLHRLVAVVDTGAALLLMRGERGKVMADLWEFPYFDLDINVGAALDLKLDLQYQLPLVRHTFTRFRATLYPKVFHAEQKEVRNPLRWVSYDKLNELPFSSGHRRIFNGLKSAT